MPQHIIIHGNPVEGFGHIGPFDFMEAAHDYATTNFDGDWWVKELVVPEGREVDAPHEDVIESFVEPQTRPVLQHELPIFAVAVNGAAMSPINTAMPVPNPMMKTNW